MELQSLNKIAFPNRISLAKTVNLSDLPVFRDVWASIMKTHCHHHPVWTSDFSRCLASTEVDTHFQFQLAAAWSINMVVGSYCFPRYVAALASRAEYDALRHGLLENAWDESGSHGHTARSHFWLAVRLAKLLQVNESEIESIRCLPEAEEYTDEHFNQCAHGDFDFALGMICLIEEFTTPEFSLILRAFLRSVRDAMGMEKEDFILNGGAEYFTANIADDERHREEMPALVATLLKSRNVDLSNEAAVLSAIDKVKSGIKYSADLRSKFFDGIYKFVCDGGKCTDLYELTPFSTEEIKSPN